MSTEVKSIPAAYVWRRVHSLFGLWFTLFLTEHLITNSQSALLFGNDGAGFIRAVNWIHNLPYRVVIEVVLLGVPIAFHAGWGIYYMISSKMNSFPSKGNKPSLPQYSRNQAYTWQRITAWVLLVGVVLHVTYMRFLEYPADAQLGSEKYYFTELTLDPGLYTVAKRLNVSLYNDDQVQALVREHVVTSDAGAEALYDNLNEEYVDEGSLSYSAKVDKELVSAQTALEEKQWLDALSAHRLGRGQVMAVSPSFGTATLLLVRDTFKSVWVSALYTVFVLCAAFHGFNGLWTFFITWGTILRIRSQKVMSNVCTLLIVLIAFLGLMSVWGTYWINLRY